MIYYIYYVLFNDNSYKPIVIIAVYDTGDFSQSVNSTKESYLSQS